MRFSGCDLPVHFPCCVASFMAEGTLMGRGNIFKSCYAAPDLLCKDSQFAPQTADSLLVFSSSICDKTFYHLQMSRGFPSFWQMTTWLHVMTSSHCGCIAWYGVLGTVPARSRNFSLNENGADLLLSDPAAPAIAFHLLTWLSISY